METSKDFASAGRTGAIMPLARPDAPAGIHSERKLSRLLLPVPSVEVFDEREPDVIRPSLLGLAELYDSFEFFAVHWGDGKAIAFLQN